MLTDPHLRTETLSDSERQSLILEYLPQVQLEARRIHGRLPESVSLDDLVSTGVVGLISAIDRFDPSRRVQLRTYAGYKIRGRILDSLRRLDWAPRQHRKRAKQIEAAIARAAQRLQRSPTEDEIATELKIGIDVYRQWQANLDSLNLERLESIGLDDSDSSDRRLISHDEKGCPSAVFERGELQRALSAAISALPEIHQTVLSLYYSDELRPREISKITGLQESRISWIRAQAIRKLRACMAKLWPTKRTSRQSQLTERG